MKALYFMQKKEGQMYPVSLGFDNAKIRINNLLENKHYAEALLTSVFTLEKMTHRTLKQLVVSSGFRSEDANTLLGKIQGFHKQKDVWLCFDPKNRPLTEIIDNNHWQYVNCAVKMRNKLVHGKKAYKLKECESMAKNILLLLDHIADVFNKEYGYNGWSKVRVRKTPKLHTDPTVKGDSIKSRV